MKHIKKMFNILGFGTNCGRWLKQIPKFIRDEVRTAGKQNKCWVFYMKEIPNFCTVFDLDFRFPEKGMGPEDDVLIEFGGKLRTLVQDQLGKSVDVLLTRKRNRPSDAVTIRGKQCFKGGCHFYLLEHRFTKIEATKLRKSFEAILPSWNCLGPIIDEGVYPLGSTGIMMIHSPKRLGACYDVCVAVISNTVQLITHHRSKDLKWMYKRIVSNDCYISPILMTITHNVRESPTVTRTVCVDVVSDFNLPLFLSLVPSLNNEDWKDLMYFLKLSNLSTDFICNSLNKHYRPKDLHENKRILKDRKSSFRKASYKIKRQNVVRILQRNKIDYNYVDLFFPHKCRFINHVFELCHKSIVIPRRTLDRKLKECFSYVAHQKDCLHYKRLIPIEGGEDQWSIGHVVTQKTDNRNIYVYDWNFAVALQAEEEDAGVRAMQIDLFVRSKKKVAKKHTLSKIIEDMMLEEEFKVYEQTVCRPYLESWAGLTTQLNVWALPELYYYKPTADVDIKKTNIWFHLTNILCWGNEYKIAWLFSCVAEKIQNPGRKLNKILNFVSAKNGAGKSSFFYFVVALLGVNKTFELKDLSQLQEKFNSWQESVLWVLVDDIESMSKKEHEMLKSLCTARQMKIERKNCDSVQSPCSYDIIITSNHQNNFYSNSEDRRNEMIIVNDTVAKGREFWDKFYEEMKDKNIMKSFFEFFRHYKIPLDVHQKTCRFDKKALQERVADSLEITHEFLRILFELDTFFRPTKASCHEIDIFPSGYFYVTKYYLLKSLCQWEHSNNGRKQITMKTMLNSLKKLGIVIEKVRCKTYFGDKQPRRIVLSQKLIQRALLACHDTTFSFPDFGFKESCSGLVDDLIQMKSQFILTLEQIAEKIPSPKRRRRDGFAPGNNLLNSMTVSGFSRKQFLMRHAHKNSS